MGGASSTITPSVEGKYLAVPNLGQFSTRTIPSDYGRLPCYVARKSDRWMFYLRCLKEGRVRKKTLLYCKQKSNGNFRVYKPGSRNPIGYIKKGTGNDAYRVYCGRQYCAKICVRQQRYQKITTMVIRGGVQFESRVRYQILKSSKTFRVDTVNPCNFIQSFAFAVLCSV